MQFTTASSNGEVEVNMEDILPLSGDLFFFFFKSKLYCSPIMGNKNELLIWSCGYKFIFNGN